MADGARGEDSADGRLIAVVAKVSCPGLNLNTLNKVMKKYPSGRFFFQTQINKNEAVLDLINELKEEVERATRDANPGSRSLRRTDETQLKALLRDRLIQCVFTNTSVEFVNAGIWAGKKSPVSTKLSTGQKIALEFMWIVRQAEYEIERGLQELTSKQAAKSRAKANRVILVDGIFSTLSDRRIIAEALNGLRDLGGNFQIIGLSQSDFYQLFAYGQKYLGGAGRMALIYPLTEKFQSPLDAFDFGGGLSLEVLPFDLDQERLLGVERLGLRHRPMRLAA